MGWTYTAGATKKSIVEDIIERKEWDGLVRETIEHCVRGLVLWAVQRMTRPNAEPDTFIVCYLLGANPGYGWGYKDMTEEMGPYFYSCPLSYLELAPEADATWRARVRAYHAARKVKLVIGQVIKLKESRIPEVELVSLKPLIGVHAGARYRIPKRMIDVGLPAPNDILYPRDLERKNALEAGQALRYSALSTDDGRVHVLFETKNGQVGHYMSPSTYDAIPLARLATPEDFRQHGPLWPAPPSFEEGAQTKMMRAA